MKKRLFGVLLAAACTAGMAVSAFAADADEVMQNYVDATAAVTGMSATVEGVADISMVFPDRDMSFGITGNMNMDMDVTIDPLAAEVDASMGGDVLGQGSQYDFKMYMLSNDDGTMPIYIGMETEEGEGVEWALTTIDGDLAARIQGMLASGSEAKIADLPIDFVLADETVDVEGIESYVLTATMTWEDIMGIYNTAMEVIGDALPADQLPDQETLDMVGSLFGGLQMNLEIDVAVDTYLPTRAHFDMDGSDWVTLSATIAALTGMTNDDGSLMSLNLDVKDLYLDYLYDYSEPVSVEVPQEVIDNATDIGSVSELTGMAAGMVGSFDTEEG